MMKNYGFAFNDRDFSDRVLRVEIIPDDPLESDSKRKRDLMDQTGLVGDAAHSEDCFQVKTFHVSSPILAKKSPFFYKLFKNGMRESQEKHLILRIKASEEEALMDVLKFIYYKTLSATTNSDLLKVLMIADKYEVITCVKHCSELLTELPMTLESVTLCLQVLSSVLISETIKPQRDAAEQCLADLYKLQDRAMSLSLSDVELLLRSDDLQVQSEDDVYDFIVKWASANYPTHEEYKEILNKRLLQFIRFSYMSSSKLEEVLVCADFDNKQVSKIVREALLFKAGSLSTEQCTHVARDYELHPVRVTQLESSLPRCVVSFNLKREVCANLFPSNTVESQSFLLGGLWFYLSARYKEDEQNSLHHFDLYVGSAGNLCELDFEFEVMKKPLKEFESMFKSGRGVEMKGYSNLFEIPWADFMAEDSEYFIDGILHLRADITIIDSRF